MCFDYWLCKRCVISDTGVHVYSMNLINNTQTLAHACELKLNTMMIAFLDCKFGEIFENCAEKHRIAQDRQTVVQIPTRYTSVYAMNLVR